MKLNDKDWCKHAKDCLVKMKEFRLTSPLGYFSSPEEYMEVVEDFMKLFYPPNQIPTATLGVFKETAQTYELLKKSLGDLCQILLEKAQEEQE